MIIGIDPDVDRSGIAAIDPGETILSTLSLWSIFELLEETSNRFVIIEAGWKNKKGLAFGGGRMRAIRTGMNHAIGRQIEAYCKAHDIEHELFVPSKRTPVWDHETLIRLTGLNVKQSNPETRAAVRAVYFSTKGKEVFK